MIIFYGTNTFGPVDEIENVGRVETRFFHVWFLPLIPLGSHFVLDGDDDHALRVPFSFKSLASAWMRAALGWGGVALAAYAGYQAFGSGAVVRGAASALAAVASFVAFWLVGRMMARCTKDRRVELLRHMGIAAPPPPPPVVQLAPQLAPQLAAAPAPRAVQETTQLWDLATPIPHESPDPHAAHSSSYPPPAPVSYPSAPASHPSAASSYPSAPPPAPRVPDYSQGEDSTMFLQPAFAQAGPDAGWNGGGWR
jgi:hypothetical protein